MEWISIKDMLPETNREVLVFTRDKDFERIDIGKLVNFWKDSKGVVTCEWHDFEWNFLDPSFWMPLPPAPKEETIFCNSALLRSCLELSS